MEKQLERIAAREAELHAEMEANLSDYDLLARVGDQLGELAAEKDELELEWLEAPRRRVAPRDRPRPARLS